MAKTKYIMHQCAYCRRETKMEFVGGQPNESTEAETIKMYGKILYYPADLLEHNSNEKEDSACRLS